MRLHLLVALGGYTTFSVEASVVIGLAACWAGWRIVHALPLDAAREPVLSTAPVTDVSRSARQHP